MRHASATGPNPDVYYGQSISNSSAGRLSTPVATTACNSSVAFTLTDSDLKGAGSQAISLATSGGDTETLSLIEQAGVPGTFTGSIATAAAPVVAGDGVVQAQDGVAITATYNDANTGDGTPAVVTTQVKVDCAGPAVSNVHVVSISGADAVVGIAASEPASLLVKYGLATLFNGITNLHHMVQSTFLRRNNESCTSCRMRSTSESWMSRKIATSSSDGSRRSRPVLEKSMRMPCLSMSVWM